jgi:hypothetical protein
MAAIIMIARPLRPAALGISPTRVCIYTSTAIKAVSIILIRDVVLDQ